MPEKTCFVISTIGSDQSPERKLSDQKMIYLFEPILKELGYIVKRADLVDVPGSISLDIVSRLISSDIVIADVTDLNPNVFYELAIRNAVFKPVIIIKKPDQKPPFDIQDTRAISVDMSNPDIWQSAKITLKKQVEYAEQNPELSSKSILSDFTKDLAINPASPNIDDDIQLRLKSISDDLKSIKREPLSQKIEVGRIIPPISIPSTREFTNSPDMLSISLDNDQYYKTDIVNLTVICPLLNGYRKKVIISILAPGDHVITSFITTFHSNNTIYPIYIRSENLAKGNYVVEVKLDSFLSYAAFMIIESQDK
jgi:hypothetical protein